MTSRLLCCTALLSTLVFTSCGDIQFSEPMPEGAKAVQDIPEECRGIYLSPKLGEEGEEQFAFELTADALILENETLHLGENFTILKKGKLFYANFKSGEDGFFVVPFEPLDDGSLKAGMFWVEEDENLAQLRAISPAEKAPDDLITVFKVSPTDKEFQALMKSDLLQYHIYSRKP